MMFEFCKIITLHLQEPKYLRLEKNYIRENFITFYFELLLHRYMYMNILYYPNDDEVDPTENIHIQVLFISISRILRFAYIKQIDNNVFNLPYKNIDYLVFDKLDNINDLEDGPTQSLQKGAFPVQT